MLSEPSLARFLKSVIEAAEDEDLLARPPDLFERRMRASCQRLTRREGSGHVVHVVAGDGPGAPDVVDVFSTDMPFIVDSVLAAIRAEGGVVRLLLHPVIEFDPTTFRVLDKPGPDSRPESFLHVEIDALPGPAAREALKAEIERTLRDVALAVLGWRPMLQGLHQTIEDWRHVPGLDLHEAMLFLGWLAEHNFTFLGMRVYEIGADGGLVAMAGSGLGILDDSVAAATDDPLRVIGAEARRAEPVRVRRSLHRARVHRRSFMDEIGVTLFDPDGQPSGELRILGLFTSMSLATPNLDVPLIRRKVEAVLEAADLDPESHAGKALMNVLDTYPRDELFQIGVPELSQFALLIMGLSDRPRVRVLARRDPDDRFVTVLCYVPRDRYDSEVRKKIGAYLSAAFAGEVVAYTPYFPEGDLVRVQLLLTRTGSGAPQPDREALETAIAALIRTFADRLLASATDPALVDGYLDAFPDAYEDETEPTTALADIAALRALGPADRLGLRLVSRPDGMGLRLYHRDAPMALSDRVPVLEHFGFRVIDETTHRLTPREGGPIILHDMLLSPPEGSAGLEGARLVRIEAALRLAFAGEIESDGFNLLTTLVGLAAADVRLVRALGRYLMQVGLGFSLAHVARVLARSPGFAEALVRLVAARHDPAFAAPRDRAVAQAVETARAEIAATSALDADQILRRLLNAAEAILRTNAYRRTAEGREPPVLALKFDCTRLDGLPEPRPYREIFVYSPRVEGLHLRMGPIARGGLRWSDRPEDFRTEVLGLVKAQQVKNAIIVPVGAKGAFVPRQLPAGGGRDAVLAEGTAAYRLFVSALLDLTDNREGEKIVPPMGMLRRDGDDPYLVVAADKGTASFSDLANTIATEHQFWLGDAFASGGSAGYDHKEMGITARGAWESVKRHFHELGTDIATTPFSVVGVGDMSGDVFGNGMLLSDKIRLVAAFDHRDIFIDPDPDPERSLAERRRLFELPRSSWQDYDKSLLSPAGGIYPRNLKSIELGDAARQALGITAKTLTPAELIRAILAAPVDLLWFGGIGTYLRGPGESDADVADHANDAVRISADQVRARVVAEGANLGVTQRARIAYALRGGRINSDAIDNSAGVNSSDLEVNIKIALGPLVKSHKLGRSTRVQVLESLTDEVAALCLANNFLQTLALSIEERRGPAAFDEEVRLLRQLEAEAGLNRAVEVLPDDAALEARRASGKALTRPEMAVLMAYAKNSLNSALVESTAPDDSYLAHDLVRYFPPRLVAEQPEAIAQHQLRREVIATVLVNDMLNRGGPAFVNEMRHATGADLARITAAYVLVRDAFGLRRLFVRLDALDAALPAPFVLGLYRELQEFLRRQCLWFIGSCDFGSGVGPLVERFTAGIAAVGATDPAWLGPDLAKRFDTSRAAYRAAGLEEELAADLARLILLAHAPELVLVADRAGSSVADIASVHFALLARLGLAGVIEEGERLALSDRIEQMARERALMTLDAAIRRLDARIAGMPGDPAQRLESWEAAHPGPIGRASDAIAGLGSGPMTLARLSVIAGLVGELANGV